MANIGSSINIGSQQVSIFPYEELSSVYGNQIIEGIANSGISNVIASIANDTSTSKIKLTIKKGAVFFFKRTANDPITSSIVASILGKVYLNDDAVISFDKSIHYNNTNGYLKTSKALYLVADWKYDLSDAASKYINFTVMSDSDYATFKKKDNTEEHVLLVATFLNNLAYVTAYSGTPAIDPSSYYHISYDFQPRRNIYSRQEGDNDQFIIDFDLSGKGLFIEFGNYLSSNSLLYTNPSVITNRGTVSPTVDLATKATSTVPDRVTGATTTISGLESTYNQVDFLRYKLNKGSEASGFYWESFVVLNTNWGTYTLVKYLAQFQFPIVDDGLTLLIGVRTCSSLFSDVTYPLWPENCVTMKDFNLAQSGNSLYKSRIKIPVLLSSDITQFN